jgi:hypothetical protein
MAVRTQKKYIRTDSTTPVVKKSKANRINIQAAVFFVLQNNYPKAMTTSQIQDELAKDGIDVNQARLCKVLGILSGSAPDGFKRVNGKYVCTFRNELKRLAKKVKGCNLYKWNPKGTVRLRKVLGTSSGHKVTIAVAVRRR